MSLLKHAKQYLSNQSTYSHLNAFVSLADPASILSRAEAADSIPDAHETTSPGLAGKLIAIKDNICTTELPTTASSAILKNFTSPYDATVVKQLRDAGAIVAGKTNMDEFGMGSHSTHSHFGPVKFARHSGEQLSAGGSSGGSAVAVASAQCWAALGTDTGGSVRLPAAYTGVVGFKPSYGLLSRWGVIAYANSLDTVGILGRDVESVESVFNKLNSYDPQDPTSIPPSTRSRLGSDRNIMSLRIGIPLDYNMSTLQPAVRRAWIRSLKALQDCGHTLHSVHLPATQHALSAYYVLAPAEASSNLAKYDGVRYGTRAEGIDGTPDSVLFAKTRGQGFGPEVQRRILHGAFTLSAQAMDNYFIQAQKVRRLVQRDFDSIFYTLNPLVKSAPVLHMDAVDVLVCPTTPTLPPTLSDVENQDPLNAYMNDVFTVPASLAGIPAISVPVDLDPSDRNPELVEKGIEERAGMQVIGQYGDDALVLDVAKNLFVAATRPSPYSRTSPFITAWGKNPSSPADEVVEEAERREKLARWETEKLESRKVQAGGKLKVVPGYGLLDKYPSAAVKKERKRLGAKAKELGITLEEYRAKLAAEEGKDEKPEQ
ncbi:glutamyl-tRNA amidotransferas-like protein [Massariosphaeria phaeospora]|uniref:Glutamyl-tRNA(Gln) amidotransferase subunit A, mitochondrial n=1 Tax=Massariosphaeria phaeospora TaxID=100035 RepID=A0A7C8MCI5_9PLEO|nr:glutamyl-tRNA amidotransferas-like protein [Massariosphaeria phaeospora]